MKLQAGCCDCCAESLLIAGRPETHRWRRPVHGCACRFIADPEARCPCRWCATCTAWWPRCARDGCEEPQGLTALCTGHYEMARTRQRARSRRQAEVRRPPRPPFEGQAGRCAMCGLHPLPPRRRSWCSKACVDLWNLATSPAWTSGQLQMLHGPSCWECGETWLPGERPWWWRPDYHGPPDPRPVALALDHVRPLWSLTESERAELRWWLPFNLQLLCGRCHGAKTRREAGERAALRRGACNAG